MDYDSDRNHIDYYWLSPVLSCFVAKKNKRFCRGEKESLSSELWTEKKKKKSKERVGEILSETG